MFEYLHPILASFPFPLLVAAFITELGAYLGFTKAWRFHSGFIILLATMFAVLAYYSGYYSAELSSKTFKVSAELISEHQSIAQLFLLSLFPTSLFALLRMIKNNEVIHWILVPCLVVSMLLSALSAHRGGMLVFKHGAGVQLEGSFDEVNEDIPVQIPSPTPLSAPKPKRK